MYPENEETIRYVAIAKRKVLMFFTQSTQLKLIFADDYSAGVYFREINFSRIEAVKMPHEILATR